MLSCWTTLRRFTNVPACIIPEHGTFCGPAVEEAVLNLISCPKWLHLNERHSYIMLLYVSLVELHSGEFSCRFIYKLALLHHFWYLNCTKFDKVHSVSNLPNLGTILKTGYYVLPQIENWAPKTSPAYKLLLHETLNWLWNHLGFAPMPLYELHQQTQPAVRSLALSIQSGLRNCNNFFFTVTMNWVSLAWGQKPLCSLVSVYYVSLSSPFVCGAARIKSHDSSSCVGKWRSK